MTEIHDSRDLPNDDFGYSAYTVVAHADPEHVRKVNEVRAAIGLTRATIDAHVTVRGTFFAIESLTYLRDLLRKTATAQRSATVRFNTDGWTTYTAIDGRQTTLMHCDTTPDLLALNKAFDEVIRPRSKNAYSDTYRAHLTLCQDCTDEQTKQALALAAKLDIGTGFELTAVQLMGRVGVAFGGEWKLIESFTLGQ